MTLALGVSSVACLTGSRVDVALGASSPAIVAGWHDRRWAHHVPVMRETIECLRSMFTGGRVEYLGRYVNSRGFRLRNACPDTRIALGAFGPGMIRLAAQHADEVVLNLASPARVARDSGGYRRRGRRGRARRAAPHGVGAGRVGPRCCRTRPTGGSAGRVSRPARLRRNVQRAGFRRPRPSAPGPARRAANWRPPSPSSCSIGLCAGLAERVADRLSAYLEAGADCVAVVPVHSRRPGSTDTLSALSSVREV